MRKITGMMISALMAIFGLGNAATIIDTTYQLDIATSSWQSTGIEVQTNDYVYLLGFGSAYAAGWGGIMTLRGPACQEVNSGGNQPVPDIAVGIIGKIGNSTPFPIGHLWRYGPWTGQNGTLYVVFNDVWHADNSGTLWVGIIRIRGITAKEEGRETPNQESLLKQNRPNPSRLSATIEYSIPKEGKVSLRVYNESGQLVKTLLDELVSAGNYTVAWNGKDAYDKEVPAGTYFYTLDVNGKTTTKKAIIVE